LFVRLRRRPSPEKPLKADIADTDTKENGAGRGNVSTAKEVPVAQQTSGIRQFTCIVATTGREGGDGITMVTVGACDYAGASTAAREAVAARFGCACDLLDFEPTAG
jgi:hypothetical protein